MLKSFSPAELEKGRNISLPASEVFPATELLFNEHYIEVGEGLYITDMMFDMLAADLISTADPFMAPARAYWQVANEFLDSGDLTNPIFLAARAAYDKYLADETFPHASYGVCDSPEQVAERFPALLTDPRRFVILFTEHRKEDQPENDGWRWHKWGEYIGIKNPQREYLVNEDETIDKVYSYHIKLVKE